jgi:S1-C subfamily serine protease
MIKAALLIVFCVTQGISQAGQFPGEPLNGAPVFQGQVDKNDLRINRSQLNTQTGSQDLPPPIQAQIPQTRLQLQTDHGELPVGVMGSLLRNIQGTPAVFIANIFPGSDAANSCRINDVILFIDGRRLHCLRESYSLIRGVPGQTRRFTIERAGRIFDVYIRLTDSRQYVNYDYDGYYHWCNGLIKRW